MTVSQMKLKISTKAWHHIDAHMHHVVVRTFSTGGQECDYANDYLHVYSVSWIKDKCINYLTNV